MLFILYHLDGGPLFIVKRFSGAYLSIVPSCCYRTLPLACIRSPETAQSGGVLGHILEREGLEGESCPSHSSDSDPSSFYQLIRDISIFK